MVTDGEDWRFEGFSNPNYTNVPDEFFDEVAPKLKEGELRVLLYIIRRTFGFKKDEDNISISQMVNGIVRKKDGSRLDKGTGLKKTAVCAAINGLQDKGLIVKEKCFDRRYGAIASAYRLNIKRRINTPVPPSEQGTGDPSPSRRTGGIRSGGEGLSVQANTQHTVSKIQLNTNVNASNKNKKRSPLHELKDAQTDPNHIKLIAEDILDMLGDIQSKRFYLLVARKIPEETIRAILSELKNSRVRSKARLFTRKILDFSDFSANHQLEQEVEAMRANLARILREK